jgi:hypothetical protein
VDTRTTVLAMAALVVAAVLARYTALPAELAIPAWPALAAAFLLDAALYNELNLAIGDAGFWALFTAFALVEASALVAVARAIRGRNSR